MAQLPLFPGLPETASAPSRPPIARLTWGLMAMLLLLFIWACWATGQLLALSERKVVAVDLGRIMSDFVRQETAREQAPQEAATRAAMFARIAEEGINAMASDGNLVLVSQAVVGRSARDATPDLVRYIDRRMSAGPSAPMLIIPSAPADAPARPPSAPISGPEGSPQ